jgi:hypothetical protein
MGGERTARPNVGHRTAGAGVLLLAMLAGGAAEANSVTVDGRTGLGGPGFRLEVTLEDPVSTEPNDAWVGIGPDKGMAAETHVAGRFVIDPGALRLPPDSPSHPSHLCFLGLSETEDWSTVRLILFLQQGPDRTWLVGARVWDDEAGGYVSVGPAPLTVGVATTSRSPGTPRTPGPGPSAVLVDFEWSAESAPGARDGLFRLHRTVDGARELVLEHASLTSATQNVRFLRAGLVNGTHQSKGTFGRLSLDEVSLSRAFGPPAP